MGEGWSWEPGRGWGHLGPGRGPVWVVAASGQPCSWRIIGFFPKHTHGMLPPFLGGILSNTWWTLALPNIKSSQGPGPREEVRWLMGSPGPQACHLPPHLEPAGPFLPATLRLRFPLAAHHLHLGASKCPFLPPTLFLPLLGDCASPFGALEFSPGSPRLRIPWSYLHSHPHTCLDAREGRVRLIHPCTILRLGQN